MATTVSTYALTDLARVKRSLSISTTDDDDLLGEIINAVSDRIEQICNRQFKARDYTERYSGDGTDTLVLPQYPINSIDSITLITGAGDTEAETTIDADTYRYHDNTGLVYRTAGVWAEGFRNYEVAYNAGQSTIAEDLQQLATEMAVAAYRARGNAGAFQSESLGDYSYTLASTAELSSQQRMVLGRWADAW